eukprot:COSAG01_NODE_3047_length_6671_cov_13.818624_2_plen_68_part_00
MCLVPENLNVAAADDLRRMHNEHFAPQVLDNITKHISKAVQAEAEADAAAEAETAQTQRRPGKRNGR